MADEQIPEEIEEEPEQKPAPGLSEPSKEAIRGGAERLVDKPKKPEQPPPSADLPAGKAGATGGKPTPSQAPSPGAKPKPETPEQPSPSTPKVPEGEKGPSGLGKLGRGLGTAGTAADIAHHPKEGAKEAGKAVAGAAAKKAAKEASKRALQLLTSETGIGPVIIEALDKLWNALKKIPGFSGFSNWAWKNKWLVLVFLVFLWMMPGILFAAGLASLTGGLEEGLFGPISPFMGHADHLLLFPQGCDETRMAQAIDQYISSQQPKSPLIGRGQAFIESAKHFGISPFFSVAQAQAENQFATNPRPVAGVNSTGSYNPFGITNIEGTAGQTKEFFDGKQWVRYAKYQNWTEGIAAHDKIIRGYLDQGITSFNGVVGKYITGNPQSANPARVKAAVLAINQMMALAGCSL